MKVVFMGTPEFAVPCLQALYQAGHRIAAVFTQPDRPAGRGKKITASPVKILAERLGLPVYQSEKIREAPVVETIRRLAPDCIVVVAYGQILPKEILDLPQFGCINVHASLLPAYRGAAPIHWAVINGETKTGVTTMLMDEGLDTGDMLLQQEIEIPPWATTGDIHDALKDIGAEVLIKTLSGLEKNTLRPVPQPQEFTYAPLLKKEHERLEWSWPAEKIHNRIRGLSPWPGSFTTFRGELIKIWKSGLGGRISESLSGLPENAQNTNSRAGTIAALSKDSITVLTGRGLLEIFELQPAGKKKVCAGDFINGRRVGVGELFD